jgi:hypothetical protein
MAHAVQGIIVWIELTDVFVLVMGRLMLMLAFCCTMGSKADVIGYTLSVRETKKESRSRGDVKKSYV